VARPIRFPLEISVSIDPAINAAMQAAIARAGITQSQLGREALKAFLTATGDYRPATVEAVKG
jgi:hypothetical protein